MKERLYTEGNQVLFDAQDETGVSQVFDCACFDNIIVAVTAPANASLTFKFQGSLGKSVSSAAAPDFSSAQAVTNHWDYIAAFDVQDPTSVILGDTGVTINNDTAANNTRLYSVNVSTLRYFSLQVSAYTDGSLTAFVMGSTV